MRVIGYLWALPITLLGLPLAILASLSGGSVQLQDGVVEAWGGLVGKLLRGGRFYKGGAAMTLGHVVLARDADCLVSSRAHELVHVRQFERWGPLLLPVYWLVGGMAVVPRISSVSGSSDGATAKLNLASR